MKHKPFENMRSKNMEKKAKPKIVKTKSIMEQWELCSYTGNTKDGTLTLAGKGKVWCFSEKAEHLEAVRKAITSKDVEDMNRQKKTDLGNDLRTGQSTMAALKAMAKEDKAIEPLFAQMAESFAQGKLNKGAITQIEAILAAKK
jgi:hypothetical protein